MESLKFKRLGSGERLVVLLHGFGSGPLEWHGLIPALESQFELLIPNLSPLFSSQRPIPFSKQVTILGSHLNSWNSDRRPFSLVGSSYGGTLSFALRAHFQGLVENHCLINPMPLDPLRHLKDFALRALFGMNMIPGALPLFLNSPLGRQQLESIGAIFGLNFHPSQLEPERVLPLRAGTGKRRSLTPKKLNLVSRAVQRFAWIAQHEDWSFWREQVKGHMIPTLLIAGAQDPLFAETDFRSYQMMVPMSEYHPLEHADHQALKSHADAIAEILLDLLGSDPKLGLKGLQRLTPTG